MKAWFGEQVDGRWVIAGRDPAGLAAFAGRTDSASSPGVPCFEEIALHEGLCASRADYLELLHRTAMIVAKARIQSLLSSKDADIVQSIRALDTVNEAFNEVSERLTEWFGIHSPDRRVRPQEIIAAVLNLSVEQLPAGAPLGPWDLTAMQGFARTAQVLLEERRSLEKYLTACMEDVAPNLSDVLGPLLGARLIARAGSLDRLARLPAGSIQVMGAGEALFKHIREGTPSPKHGFIYRHPLISGSPKRLRGKMSRMIAGRAAIAARVDAYSGGQLTLGTEVREKADRLRGEKRRPAP